MKQWDKDSLVPSALSRVTATALSVHAKAPAESVKPLTSSYFRGNVNFNFEEAISLHGHVNGLTKGGLHCTPGELFWTLLIVTVPAQTLNRLI